MEATEVVIAYGHENVQASHKSTFAITKEKWLSKRGDCIIAVSAEKGLNELSERFRESLRRAGSKLVVLIEAGGLSDVVVAYGSPLLVLAHPTDMVVRKSSYICNRTLAVYADKAACNLSRELVKKLKNPNTEVRITLTVSA
ncbi:MAG: DUF371 domain-containing protein [Nitrososphaerota archaeon]|nr:DUF371 domain-containing protein [Candidatus Bathyarchaeota archaeon]MDW8024151.1 DUF371 domain-containing protein [Nitrososphaerota archaeon]